MPIITLKWDLTREKFVLGEGRWLGGSGSEQGSNQPDQRLRN